jgi:hypothetical protein
MKDIGRAAAQPEVHHLFDKLETIGLISYLIGSNDLTPSAL